MLGLRARRTVHGHHAEGRRSLPGLYPRSLCVVFLCRSGHRARVAGMGYPVIERAADLPQNVKDSIIEYVPLAVPRPSILTGCL